MLNSDSNTPSLELKGNNTTFSNPVHSEQSESSTGDSNPIGEFCKFNEENSINHKSLPIKRKNKIQKLKKDRLLNKKIKRDKTASSKKDNIINNIFNKFKTNSSSLYKKFPQFQNIEKKVKNEFYQSVFDFADDIRKTFSNIFLSLSTKIDYFNYNRVLTLSEFFETIYKQYDRDSKIKKAKMLFEEINKLKREIHKIESEKSKDKGNSGKAKKNNKNEISIKKYKEDITNNINKLNLEQKKGILKILSNALIDSDEKNNIVEFNINKIPLNQLKQLDKYILKCINGNYNYGNEKCENLPNKIINEKQENIFCKEDDNYSSSVFSDDESDEDLD